MPGDSPYQTLDELVAAWKADPGNSPVGGASNPGGPDHLTPMLLAKAVGVTPKDVNYVAYDGGGELLAGILGNKVAFAATGVGEVAEQAKAGDVRILAVTSEEPVEGVDAPTLSDGRRHGVHQLARHRGAPRHLRTRRRRSTSTC